MSNRVNSARVACVFYFPLEPLGNFRVKRKMKLEVRVLKNAPCSIPE